MTLITLWAYCVINLSADKHLHENNRDGPSFLNCINDRQLCNNVLLKYETALDRWQFIWQCLTYKFYAEFFNFVIENLVDITTLWETPATINKAALSENCKIIRNQLHNYDFHLYLYYWLCCKSDLNKTKWNIYKYDKSAPILKLGTRPQIKAAFFCFFFHKLRTSLKIELNT